MALIDYKDRTYDYFALQGVKPVGDAQLSLQLFSKEITGQVCTGPQKLAQRWLLEFLTETGSMPGLPNRGCTFMTKVRQGTLRTYSDVWTAFVFGAYQTSVTLLNEEDDTWPDDERLLRAELLSLTFFPGYANLNIQIISRAGNSRAVILPISTLPQTLSA